MKTKVLLLGTVVSAFAITTFAAEPLLTPRAAGNQIKHVNNAVETPVVTIAYADSNAAQLSPRAAANQIKAVKGMNNDANPALGCQNNMAGAPKTVAECSAHTTMP